jgi:hypothetical protein
VSESMEADSIKGKGENQPQLQPPSATDLNSK